MAEVSKSDSERGRGVLQMVWPVLVATLALAAGYGARGAEGAELTRRVEALEVSERARQDAQAAMRAELAALRAESQTQNAAVLRELNTIREQLSTIERR